MNNDATQTNELVKIWTDVFSRYPKGVLANQKKLDDQIEKFGIAFGKIKAEIVRHKLGGMSTAASAMKTKLDGLEKDFDANIYQYLGYPLVDSYVKPLLKEKATKQGKFFNEYVYTSYPRPIPKIVFESIQIAKQYFPPTNIKVWAVESEPLLKDPVVVAEILDPKATPGTLTYIHYLIGIWDNDIELSDVIDTSEFFTLPTPQATPQITQAIKSEEEVEEPKTSKKLIKKHGNK